MSASTITIVLRDNIIELVVMPIGDNPKNNPVSPAIPKLNATDKTASSGKSSFCSFTNNMLTRQYPGKIVMNTNPKK